MTPARLRHEVRTFRYKPGWTFGAEIIEGQVCLSVDGPSVPDSEHPGRRFHQGQTSRWLPLRTLTVRCLETQFWRMLRTHELHEAGEFFRHRGRYPRDPHSKETP